MSVCYHREIIVKYKKYPERNIVTEDTICHFEQVRQTPVERSVIVK